MGDVRDYIRLFDRENLLRWFFLLMLGGLFFIGESVVLVFAAARFGPWLVLSCLTGTALLGLLLVWPLVFRKLRFIRKQVAWGSYPGKEVEKLLGLIVTGVLLLLPGFVSDALGLLLYITALSRALGKLVAHFTKGGLMEAYEYLKLYDF